ncbi:uncharacterized protein PHACADRAFT_266205 [Phanerochaete carnosa HHB-10118-sp]|uniref:Uncharacterized protein n=1 Tax=Phanerochaete carnosa (strain HHB-10118-sp) TaxID=650164 RepID=K5VQ15_PHACS|nr:uncharacterized protein PHACADRAFT_266205 [Phanerochaete carnosa HHB-10118-sp]EKM48689.1 hypothetical protein PHACADRAFT_266205 [Phanerochaete carnosa HHB-10118-sp]
MAVSRRECPPSRVACKHDISQQAAPGATATQLAHSVHKANLRGLCVGPGARESGPYTATKNGVSMRVKP